MVTFKFGKYIFGMIGIVVVIVLVVVIFDTIFYAVWVFQ